MKIVVKDDNGSVVIEREIKKEEVVLEVMVKNGNYAIGQREDLQKSVGAYH